MLITEYPATYSLSPELLHLVTNMSESARLLLPSEFHYLEQMRLTTHKTLLRQPPPPLRLSHLPSPFRQATRSTTPHLQRQSRIPMTVLQVIHSLFLELPHSTTRLQLAEKRLRQRASGYPVLMQTTTQRTQLQRQPQPSRVVL